MRTAFVFWLAFCASVIFVVRCQEEDDDDDGGFWAKMRKIFIEAFKGFRSLVKDMWREVQARSVDIQDWTQEILDGFKERMRRWVENRNDISTSKRNEIETYIERLRLEDVDNTQHGSR